MPPPVDGPTPAPPATEGSRPRRTRAAGAGLLTVGLLAAALLFLQPWASCPDDDAPAACPVPDDRVTVTSVAWIGSAGAAAAGAVLLLRTAAPRDDRPGERSRRPSDPRA